MQPLVLAGSRSRPSRCETSPGHEKDHTILITKIFLSSMFLFNNAAATTMSDCELEERIIAGLEEEVQACEDATLVLDQAFLDFAYEADPTGGASSNCSAKPTQLEKDVCECIAEGKGVGTGLTCRCSTRAWRWRPARACWRSRPRCWRPSMPGPASGCFVPRVRTRSPGAACYDRRPGP